MKRFRIRISAAVIQFFLIQNIATNSEAHKPTHGHGHGGHTSELSSGAEKSKLFRSCLLSRGTYISNFISRDDEFSKEAKGTTLTYESLNYQWNNATRSNNIEPLGYFVPEKTFDVQNAIRCGRQLNIRMVVKSGGHSFEKYSFGDSDSIVIDLQKLSRIQVNRLDKTATVGAGTLIGPLYWNLWANGQFGISSIFCVSPGVGGVTLGGGQGPWSKRFGMMSDSVLEMEFVDSNGRVRLVNGRTNQDLFWALLGAGGGNFGVVTSFKYQLFDASNLRATHFIFSYKVDMFEEAFRAWQTWNYKNYNSSAYGRFTAESGSIEINIVDADLSAEDIVAIRQSFPAPNAKPVTMATMSFIDLVVTFAYPNVQSAAALNRVTRHNLTQYSYRAKSYYSSKQITSDADIARLAPILTSVPRGIFVDFNSYGGAINKIEPGATAFVHRNALFDVYLGIRPESDEANAWVQQFDEVSAIFDNGESYQNFIDGELGRTTALQRSYGTNLQRLMEIKGRVDPTNYFNFPQSIPLPISRI